MRLPRKIATYATIAVLALTLGACHVDAGAGIHEDGTATIAMEFHDQYGLLGQENISSCDDFANQVIAEARKSPEVAQLPAGALDEAIEHLDVAEVPSKDGLGCRISFETPESVIDGDKITETDSTYIIDMREDTSDEIPAEAKMLMDIVDARIIVAMPGKIIKADGATIDGNRAIYESLEPIIKNGIYVEGEKAGNADFSNLFAPVGAASVMPLWAWIAIGVAIIAAIALLVFFLVRKKEPEQVTDFPEYGFTPQYDPNVASPTPMPSEQPTIPTQTTSHTQPSAPATPPAQPIMPMQSHPETAAPQSTPLPHPQDPEDELK
ncbi:hypothetical protein [Arcanobacterium phocae]|uniref:hypothetical protein n=1 Tax=Arcanobacterium phocae TaxID=131112 RepID=UPI001C0ED8F4|nr:hypothetical protein [Arcanobacterium phocae]